LARGVKTLSLYDAASTVDMSIIVAI
jgi:hypothetical protein